MCNICYARENNILSIYSNPSTMCETHYFEWSQEKMYMELDRSTEGLYL